MLPLGSKSLVIGRGCPAMTSCSSAILIPDANFFPTASLLTPTVLTQNMAPLKVGDQFPPDVVFQYVPFTSLDPKKSGNPKNYNASKEWAGKKVVLVSVPGAFTPGCQGFHIPPYIEKLKEVKGKGVDIVAVIAFNDAWVMTAWSKVNGVRNDDILFMADTETKFAKKIGWMAGMGDRNGRWAVVIDKNGKVIYAEKEKDPRKVTVSGVDAVLAKL